MTHQIELCVSPQPLAKKIEGNDGPGWARLYRTLTPTTATLGELANYVYSGHVIAPVLSGWRSYDHFVKGQFIAVDMDTEDERSAISTLIEHDFVWMYGAVIYSTPSSTESAPRSRVVFLLDRPVTDVYTYRRYIITVSRHFPGFDRSSAEPTRTFFGNARLASTRNTNGLFLGEGRIPAMPVDEVEMMYQRQMAEAERMRRPAPRYEDSDLNVERVLAKCIQRANDGNRNALGYWFACRMVENGIPDEVQEDAMRRYAEGVPQTGSPYTEDEALRSLHSARRGL